LLAGCATPKALYDGPPLPRNKVVLISGFPFTKIQEGRDGKGNFVAASGQVVIIGIDGKIFNEKIYASYSGSQFLLLPGQHSLLAYCEYTFQLSPFRMAYSDLFTIQFTAKEGREYRYQADFWLDSGDDKTRHVRQNGIVAVPGIWDVTENRSADSSNRVNEAVKPVPVNYSDLSHLQAEIGKR
jgi:hypothetical protein